MADLSVLVVTASSDSELMEAPSVVDRSASRNQSRQVVE